MSNRLFLYHRPTRQFLILAQRGEFGWVPTGGRNDELFVGLANMFQRAANGLDATQPFGHQDDFVLLMDSAEGAPYAYPLDDASHYWVGDDLHLRPPLAFTGATNRDEAAQSLQRTLAIVSGHRGVPKAWDDKGQQRVLAANDMLQAENAELRDGIRYLMEMIDLRKLGEQIFAHELLGQKHPARVQFKERVAVLWPKVFAWAEGFEERVKNWRRKRRA